MAPPQARQPRHPYARPIGTQSDQPARSAPPRFRRHRPRHGRTALPLRPVAIRHPPPAAGIRPALHPPSLLAPRLAAPPPHAPAPAGRASPPTARAPPGPRARTPPNHPSARAHPAPGARHPVPSRLAPRPRPASPRNSSPPGPGANPTHALIVPLTKYSAKSRPIPPPPWTEPREQGTMAHTTYSRSIFVNKTSHLPCAQNKG